MDRLMELARAFTEKEKFKLKQYYEDEIIRKNKAIMQEFKCAMEREVIGPLKAKLCAYEKENQQLRQACNAPPGSSNLNQMNMNIDPEELDLLTSEIEKLHQQKAELQELMKAERERKERRKESRDESEKGEGSIKVVKTDSTGKQSGRTMSVTKSLQKIGGSSGTKLAEGEPSPASSGSGSNVKSLTREGNPSATSQKQAGTSNLDVSAISQKPASKESNLPATSQKQEGGNSKESNVSGSNKRGSKSGMEMFLDKKFSEGISKEKTKVQNQKFSNEKVPPKEPEDEKTVLMQKVRRLSVALEETKKFAEDHIAEYIKESEQLDIYMQKTKELQEENDELKKRLADLEIDVKSMAPTEGTVEEENMLLRKKVQELEELKRRGSLEMEIRELRKQLAEYERKQAVAEGSIKADEISPTNSSWYSKSKESIRRTSEDDGDLQKQKSQNLLPPIGRNISGGASAKTASGSSAVSGNLSAESANQQISSGASAFSGKTSAENADKKAPSATNSTPGKALSENTSKKTPSATITTPGKSPAESANKVASGPVDKASSAKSWESTGSKIRPYQKEIDELKAHIEDLKNQLLAFLGVEDKLEELKALTIEMEALRKKFAEVSEELEKEKKRVCPVPSETELKETKKKLAEVQAKLELQMKEAENLQQKFQEQKAQNAELAKSVASLKVVEDKVVVLEQTLSDTRKEVQKKAEEIKKLAEQLETKENELLKMENELAQAREEHEAYVEKMQRQQEEALQEIDQLKHQIQVGQELQQKLQGELEMKIVELDELTIKYHDLEEEKALMEKEMAQKYANECSALSSRGQCVIEQGRRFNELGGQLNQDNEALQDRLLQIEEQLENMAKMEERTKELHLQMEELHLRAMERSKELEGMKQAPCDLNVPDAESFANVRKGSANKQGSKPTPPSALASSKAAPGAKKEVTYKQSPPSVKISKLNDKN